MRSITRHQTIQPEADQRSSLQTRLSSLLGRKFPRQPTSARFRFPERFRGIIGECKGIIVPSTHQKDVSAERDAADLADARSRATHLLDRRTILRPAQNAGDLRPH
jgi:hypothetical protein